RQMLRCGEIAVEALHRLGGKVEHVVRTRMFITDPADADAIGRAHQELFGAAPPVATMVVTRLLDPTWKIELEVEAELPDASATAPQSAAGTFSNLAGTDPSEYVRNLLALLGDRDPLTVLAEMPDAIEAASRGMDPERLRRPEKPGKWSVLEVVAHLADSEIALGWRFRHMLGDRDPQIAGYDQDAWAQRFRYADADLETSLALFRAVRTSNLRILRAATPEDLARVGVHAERGPESVGQLLKLVAAHDLVHRRQIARIQAAVA